MQQRARSDAFVDMEGGQVLHLAGRLTDEVMGFLGPTTRFLREAGARQLLVAQEPDQPRLLIGLDPSVELRLLRADLRAPHWVQVGSMVRRLVERAEGVLRAVHLHGLVPGMLAPYVLRPLGRDVPLVISPHSSKAIGPLRMVGRPLWWMTRPLTSTGSPTRAIATVSADVGGWRELSSGPVDIVEGPVHQAFFGVSRTEATTPRIVAAGTTLDRSAADLLAQLRILLDDDEGTIRFEWLGHSPTPAVSAVLRAAGISSVESAGPTERAAALAGAWAFVAPCGGAGFPSQLGEAMAAGIPCVSLDTPYHRSLVRHGETGLLYRTPAEAFAALEQLSCSPSLRRDIGERGRREAAARLTESQFRQALFAAYEHSVSRPMPL